MLETKKILCDDLSKAAAEAFGEGLVSAEDFLLMFEYPPDKTMGDIALPCFKLSRTLRKAPPLIATTLAEKLESKVLAWAKPLNGYLNFKISDEYFAKKIFGKVFRDGDKYGSSNEGVGKTVVLDYSSPNVCKPFHIGHLGTTVIGHSLKLLHQFQGYNCVGVNHLGDWGTQFGKQIVAFRKWGDRETVERIGIDELVRLYVRFHEEAERNPQLEDEARAEFHKLEEGDEENLELWRWFLSVSLAEYKKTYKQLGIEFESYNGESFYIDKLPTLIEEIKDKGLLKVDDGASIIDLSEYNMPPCIILKKDGSTIYHTRDIAAAIYRKNTYDFEKCIYITSAGQSLHFAQLFKVIDLMGYNWYKKMVHVPYGTVSINGSKLATRTGNVILLKDLFAAAVEKVGAVIDEKNPDLPNKEEVAESIGVGAIVFYYLANNRIRDINFIMDDALSFEGNTGPYVQYTYARCCSVLEKAESLDEHNIRITVPEENELIQIMAKFPEKVKDAVAEYEPSIITRYILELAGAYNRFYHNCKILTAEDKDVVNTRLALTKAVKTVLGNAFGLICLRKTEKI